MKVYLAGPDVFRIDAHAWFADARELCRRHGLEALTPLDNEETDPTRIFEANLQLIRRAQILIANLNPFRGCEPDSGTCFEMGYALALGKKVCGYIDKKEPLRQRINRHEDAEIERPVDSRGMLIENFDLPVNLMLAVPAQIVEGGLEDCLTLLRGTPGDPLPEDPLIRSAIEDAVRYARWVEAGRLADANPVATIAEHYKVAEHRVREWMALDPSVPISSGVAYLPTDVVRNMKISGRLYRARK